MNPEPLHEELEALVSRDEPHFGVTGPQVRRVATRKRTRRRAAVTMGAVLAAVLAAGSVAVLHLNSDSRSDLVTDEPLKDFSAAAFPTVIESVVLDNVKTKPTTIRVSAYDARQNPIDPTDRDKATTWRARFGWSPDRTLDVYLAYAGSEAEGQAATYCQGLERYLFSCTVLQDEDGVSVIDTVEKGTPSDGDGQWEVIPLTGDQPDTAEPIWFLHQVAVRLNGKYLRVANEAVQADSLEEARAKWQISTEDLRDIATDPQLVFPAPPPGDDGCGWVNPDGPIKGRCYPGSPPPSP